MTRRTKIIGCFIAVSTALVLVADARAATLTPTEAEARVETEMRDTVKHFDSDTQTWGNLDYRDWRANQVLATGSLAIDFGSTLYLFDRCPGAREGNPLFAWAEDDTAALALGALAFRGLSAWWQRRQYSRGRFKLAKRAAVGEFVVHIIGTGLNVSAAGDCR